MAQQDFNIGTVGDPNTGDYLYEAFQKAQNNFNDLYTNYLPKSGGTMSGNINLNYNNISDARNIEVTDNVSKSTTFRYDGVDEFEISPFGGGSVDDLVFNYITGEWEINAQRLLVTGDAATNIAFSSYLTITSANIQAALEELKDEVDAVVASAGSGDMLKSTYDSTNNGIVDNSELLQGQNSAYHLSRTNHTGTQLASTISDFNTAVSANTDVLANNAKVTNATHTGDVTGATILTLESIAITGKATVTPVSGDFVLISDTSDGGALKKVDAFDFLSGGITIDTSITDGSSNPVTNNAIYDALVNINNYVALNNIEANKIIDGEGSGLDADRIDNYDSPALVKNTGGINISTGAFINGDDIGDIGLTIFSNSNAGGALPVNYSAIWTFYGDPDGRNFAILKENDSPNVYFGTANNTGSLSWSKVWTGNNDGAGSGLDADLLDGIQSTNFARTDIAEIFTNDVNVQGTLTLEKGDVAAGYVELNLGKTTDTVWTKISNSSSNTFITLYGNQSFNLYHNNTAQALAFNSVTTPFVGLNSGGTLQVKNIDTYIGGNGGYIVTTVDPYDSTWNGSLRVPTQNAIYDKIESLGSSGVTQTAPTQFFPLLYGSASGTGVPYSIGTRYCYYVKTGRLVFATYFLNGINGLGRTGSLLLQLPFQAASLSGNPGYWSSTLEYENPIAADDNKKMVIGFVPGGTDTIRFETKLIEDGTFNYTSSLTSVDFDGLGKIQLTITYISNS
jgi:hypothetical protein